MREFEVRDHTVTENVAGWFCALSVVSVGGWLGIYVEPAFWSSDQRGAHLLQILFLIACGPIWGAVGLFLWVAVGCEDRHSPVWIAACCVCGWIAFLANTAGFLWLLAQGG